MPMIWKITLTDCMLVFVDLTKELPLSPIVRSYNFNALATFVHQYAFDEQLGEGSLVALSIAGFGIPPVIVYSLAMTSIHPGQGRVKG
jgi:iron(III) transport system permease protein